MPESANSKTKQQILLVDNDAFMRIYTHDVLEKAGFSVEMVSDCDSAIKILKKLPIDLVLLDLSMSGMDGFETCQKLRDIIGYEHTQILLIIDLDDTKSIASNFIIEATDFITKPIHPELLVHRVRYMLRANQSLSEMSRAKDRIIMLKEAVSCLPIGTGITISDIHGKIIYVNTAEAEMHGYSPEEIIGKAASKLA